MKHQLHAHIWKRFTFDAAHYLPMCPKEHKCSRMHGHTYTVTLRIQGPINEAGWVADYAQMKAWWEPCERQLDHHTLNEIEGLENPTAEVLAHWIAQRFALTLPPRISLASVEVQETPNSGAVVFP